MHNEALTVCKRLERCRSLAAVLSKPALVVHDVRQNLKFDESNNTILPAPQEEEKVYNLGPANKPSQQAEVLVSHMPHQPHGWQVS